MQIAGIVIGLVDLALSALVLTKLLKDSRDIEELERENAELLFENSTDEKY